MFGPHTWFFVAPGSSIGQAPIKGRVPGGAPRQTRVARAFYRLARGARARVARVFYRLAGARALTFACPAASRACCCVFYRLARRAGVDVNACPTASRACCCVFYRLARRAGVDVRAHYRAARLLSRNLPPRQARGRRRSRALPRRALAVAYSTASPGARGSPPCHDVKNTRARARAQMRRPENLGPIASLQGHLTAGPSQTVPRIEAALHGGLNCAVYGGGLDCGCALACSLDCFALGRAWGESSLGPFFGERRRFA